MSDLFQLIYVVPSGHYNKRWVLYDPDLRDLVPSGHTATDMSRPCFWDDVWEHERRVARDSYACPNPNCCLCNPKCFTACVTCGCKFTFEVVTGPSKVALPPAESMVGNREITTRNTRVTALESRNAFFVPNTRRSTSILTTGCSGNRSFDVWIGEESGTLFGRVRIISTSSKRVALVGIVVSSGIVLPHRHSKG